MTQEEKIKDLEERIAIMQAADSELCANLAHWKKVAAGLKGRNKQLSEQLQHYKELDLEGDDMYEKKIAECEEFQKRLDIANLTNTTLRNQNLDYKDEIEAKKQEIDKLQVALENKKVPWWRKIF